jgi:hypothetical protein
MENIRWTIRCVAFVLVLGIEPRMAAAGAQTSNAALRYWMAFAQMKNPPSDPETVALMTRVLEGSVPWNNERLGPILEVNHEALETMARGTRLSDCDWGPDDELGPFTPIEYIPRARALARLNVLEGLRLEAANDAKRAVATWLPGLRFSRDIANGGTLLATLVASSALEAHLAALIRFVGGTRADTDTLNAIEEAVRALPPGGVGWVSGMQHEMDGHGRWLLRVAGLPLEEELSQLSGLSDVPAEQAEKARFGLAQALNLRVEDLGDVARVRAALTKMRAEHSAYMTRLVAALRLPYLEAHVALNGAEAYLRESISSGTQQTLVLPHATNDRRAQVELHRAGLLGLLALRRVGGVVGRGPTTLRELEVPNDPYTGRPLALVETTDGIELRSPGPNGGRHPFVFRLQRHP